MGRITPTQGKEPKQKETRTESEEVEEQARLADERRDEEQRIKNEDIRGIHWIYSRVTEVAVVYLSIVSLVMLAALIYVWPASASTGPIADPLVILLAALAGGLGGAVYATFSMIYHLGEGTAESSYVLWYFMRPVIGLVLGVIMFFVVRGGLLVVTVSQVDLNLYGVVGISALAGISARHMMTKLRDALDSIFGAEEAKATGSQEKKSVTPKETSVAMANPNPKTT